MLTNPILFDHNADGIRTGTGWLRPDDAWLVLDRDANGIDSGRELFGVETVLSGTPGLDAAYASTGSQALRALDGNLDNLFDAQDAAFAQVRVWQDANADGTSQAGELFTLADKAIVGIALTETATTQAGTVNVATETSAANLTLANNPFYRESTDSIPLRAEARALPEMGGSGWVRDLSDAMSLGTPQAATLAGAVAAFAAGSPRDERLIRGSRGRRGRRDSAHRGRCEPLRFGAERMSVLAPSNCALPRISHQTGIQLVELACKENRYRLKTLTSSPFIVEKSKCPRRLDSETDTKLGCL